MHYSLQRVSIKCDLERSATSAFCVSLQRCHTTARVCDNVGPTNANIYERVCKGVKVLSCFDVLSITLSDIQSRFCYYIFSRSNSSKIITTVRYYYRKSSLGYYFNCWTELKDYWRWLALIYAEQMIISQKKCIIMTCWLYHLRKVEYALLTGSLPLLMTLNDLNGHSNGLCLVFIKNITLMTLMKLITRPIRNSYRFCDLNVCWRSFKVKTRNKKKV